MALLFLICCLDARHFPLLLDFIHQIKQVKVSAGDRAVLFLLSFPVQHIELWQQVLVRSFSKEEGYENVVHYFCNDYEEGITLGQAVLLLGKVNENAMLSHVQFMAAPPAAGHAKFGKSMIYVELRFSKAKKTAAQSIGILWAPDLFCVGKPYFNDANFSGAMGFMTAMMVYERYGSLCTDGGSGLPAFDNALEVFKAHLAGVIVLTDMRSEFFGDRYPIHQYKTSGKAHAVLGTFVNGEFRDTYAHEKLRCLPACYKVRPKSYQVMNHSFDLDSLCSELFGRRPAALRTNADEDRLIGTTAAGETDGQSTSADEDWSIAASVDVETCQASTSADEEPSSTPAGFWAAVVHVQDEAESECMVCLERSPTFVFEKCGHLGVCYKCRQWMCKEHFNKNKSEQSQISPGGLRMDKVADAKLKCPYCRAVTRTLHRNQYTGTAYPV